MFFSSARTKEPPSVYRTSNQAYGSRAPTVHEMPVRRKQGKALEGGPWVGVRSSNITNGKGSPHIFLEHDRVEINE